MNSRFADVSETADMTPYLEQAKLYSNLAMGGGLILVVMLVVYLYYLKRNKRAIKKPLLIGLAIIGTWVIAFATLASRILDVLYRI